MRYESESDESDEGEFRESLERRELRERIRKYIEIEKRKEMMKEAISEVTVKYRALIKEIKEKNENQNTGKEPPIPKKPQDQSNEKITQTTENREQSYKIKPKEEEKEREKEDEKNATPKNAEKTRTEQQNIRDTCEEKDKSQDKKKEEDETPKPTITKSLNNWIPKHQEKQKEIVEKKEIQEKREIKKESKEKKEKEKSDLKRNIREKTRLYSRIETGRIDFPENKHFTYNVLGKEIKIEINEKDRFKVKLENYELKAKKFVTEIGTKKNHLTIIEYETETGKFTVIKELNEIWPPWILPWYLQQQGSQVYIDLNVLKNLIENAKQIEGNVDKLVKFSGVAKATINAQLKGQRESISLKNLMSLIVFVGMNQKEGRYQVRELMKNIEGSITQVGHIEGKLYIDLLNEKGAALLAHSLGDGWLTAQGDAIHYGYSNTDKLNLQDVKDLLKDIYGLEVEQSPSQIRKNEIHIVGVPGLTLNRAGVPVGKRVETNLGIPLWFKLFANESMIVKFVESLVNDEGTTPEGFLKIPQNVANPHLERHRKIFENIIQERREKLIKKKGKLSQLDELGIKFVGLGALRRAVGEEKQIEIVEDARKIKMKFLEDTAEIMKKIGVEMRDLSVGGFTPTDKYISARWDLRLNTENTRKLDKMGALGRKSLTNK